MGRRNGTFLLQIVANTLKYRIKPKRRLEHPVSPVLFWLNRKTSYQKIFIFTKLLEVQWKAKKESLSKRKKSLASPFPHLLQAVGQQSLV